MRFYKIARNRHFVTITRAIQVTRDTLGGWAGEGYGTVSPDDTRQAGGSGLAKVFLPQGATVQVTLDLTYFPKF